MSKTKFALTLIATLTISTSAATAIAVDELKKYDFNGNKIIEPGREHKAVLNIWEQLNYYQQDLISTPVEFAIGGPGLALSKFEAPDLGKNNCKPAQRFFLTNSVVGSSLRSGNISSKAGNAASFSITENFQTNVTNWKADGALTWVFGDPCVESDIDRKPNEATISAFVFAPFLEFHGKGSNSAPGISTLRAGIQSEFEIFSGPFNLQRIKINPYYQTDFQFEARAIGIEAVWTPTQTSWRLNSRHATTGPWDYWWNFQGILDYHRVENAGFSGLTSGTHYGWVGANINASFEYKPKASNGVYGNVGFQAFHNIVSNQNVSKYTTEFGLYLDPKKKSSISVTYENGVNYQTLKDAKRLSSQFKVSF